MTALAMYRRSWRSKHADTGNDNIGEGESSKVGKVE